MNIKYSFFNECSPFGAIEGNINNMDVKIYMIARECYYYYICWHSYFGKNDIGFKQSCKLNDFSMVIS